MARLSLFNSPLLLGFEPFEEVLERISKASADGYPPYNVAQLDRDRLRITLAVAGFAPEDLEVQVRDNQLVIRGRQDEDKTTVYLHRGIAARQFQRSFVLAEGIEVTNATMDNGLLHLGLERPASTPRVRTIEIAAARQAPPRNGPGMAPGKPRGNPASVRPPNPGRMARDE